jgi:hypothetical protein
MELKNFANGSTYVEVKTAKGVLKIYETPDSEYAGINIYFEPNNGNGMDIPLVGIENGSLETSDNVVMRVWGNPWNEEYTQRTDVPIKEIVEALASE